METESPHLSVHQVALHLGVTDSTVRRYIACGRLPAYRVRGVATVRIKRTDLNQFLQPIAAGCE